MIAENTDRAASAGRGAGISFEDSRAIVYRNIITSNRCNGEGDGIYIRGNSHVPSIGNRLVSPSGGNCIHGNSNRDLFYNGAIPGRSGHITTTGLGGQKDCRQPDRRHPPHSLVADHRLLPPVGIVPVIGLLRS